MSEEPLVQVEELHRSFGPVAAVRGVSFTLARGEVLGFLGLNGAGKTTTMAMLADHPLMGAGPGGFQTMYLAYRLPIASESIADPHNFLFETLAAGGIVAGLLLAMLVFACARQWKLTSVAEGNAETADGDEQVPLWSARWIARCGSSGLTR